MDENVEKMGGYKMKLKKKTLKILENWKKCDKNGSKIMKKIVENHQNLGKKLTLFYKECKIKIW